MSINQAVPCPSKWEHIQLRHFSNNQRSVTQQQGNSKLPQTASVCRVGKGVVASVATPHKPSLPHWSLLQALTPQPMWDTAMCSYSATSSLLVPWCGGDLTSSPAMSLLLLTSTQWGQSKDRIPQRWENMTQNNMRRAISNLIRKQSSLSVLIKSPSKCRSFLPFIGKKGHDSSLVHHDAVTFTFPPPTFPTQSPFGTSALPQVRFTPKWLYQWVKLIIHSALRLSTVVRVTALWYAKRVNPHPRLEIRWRLKFSTFCYQKPMLQNPSGDWYWFAALQNVLKLLLKWNNIKKKKNVLKCNFFSVNSKENPAFITGSYSGYCCCTPRYRQGKSGASQRWQR